MLSEVTGIRPLRFEPGRPLPAGAELAEVLIPAFLTRPDSIDLTGLPKLRLVQMLTAGADGWIGQLPDGVLLSNARGAHGASVAEWVLGALLTIYREFGGFADTKRACRWNHHQTDTLAGKRVLGIGAGDLGIELRRKLEAFDATLTLVGVNARDGVHGVDELPELLGGFDVVVLMVPVTGKTIGLVDAKFLTRMADDAILVNVARGPVVDSEALLSELISGRLRAALDVTDPEPLPSDHPLWTAPGILLTPHVAGNSRGSTERAYAVAASEIARFAAGEQPKNLVHGEY
ncbi:2-hydroxyacid dehydrogenase [Nocardia sp. NBC_01009]|uniref:2-hydroxyacid dehydrogenase n=1 Tax=Nocardia sp. NBC_01009 TaxID=2975996 RepID=UPI003867D72E|nr:2-hydroxyacid dehydrogenase [Nocardia sp. NBC_01009]